MGKTMKPETTLASKFQPAGAFDGSGYPPKYKWGRQDAQPMQLPSPAEYLDVARELTPAFLELGIDMLTSAGFVAAGGKDKVMAELQDLPHRRMRLVANTLCDGMLLPKNQYQKVHTAIASLSDRAEPEKIYDRLVDAGIIRPAQKSDVMESLSALPSKIVLTLRSDDPEIGSVNLYWRIKDEATAFGKLKTPTVNQDPANIGDYFGMMLVPDTLKGLLALRDASLEHNMTSRKCELSDPSDELYRSHKSHNRAVLGGKSQSGEFQIVPAAIDDVSRLTHRLHEIERNLFEAGHSASQTFGTPHKVPTRLQACSAEFRQIRTYINGQAADRKSVV